MNSSPNIINTLKNILNILNKRRKVTLIFFFFLSLITSFAEVISISAVIPFIDLMINEEKFNLYIKKLNLNDYFNLTDVEPLYFITFIFITAIALSAFLKLLLGYVGTTVSSGIKFETTKTMFKDIISIEYLNENAADENDLLANLTKIDSLSSFLDHCLSILQSAVIFISIFVLLIFISSPMIFLGGAFFFLSYLSLLYFT